ncbi:hypothetical protein C5167_034741 [Papaver somniferum]|uniref:RNA polymerase II-associated protein 1 C-terminal domain-containing protein n=1 Tax=Papaver somniferum TaxID=3469 RepID=A0A4Y7KHC9_PAPSO|nr:transcriptional elongation regulator MINIYO [Papaver somniferum]RZC71561.1 hypothetical protein C5167_034741 [Papaver somniferum]
MSTKKKVVEIKEDSNLFELVGSIVEKGFSSESSSQSCNKRNPISFPQPTVLPFPVARHRSHGPHWAPLGSEMDVEDGNEDEDDKDFNTIPSTFAVPIQKKEKKGLSFNNWKEILQRDSLSKGTGVAKPTVRHSVKGKREREESGNIAKNSTCEPFLSRSMEFERVPSTSTETVMSSAIGVRNVDQAMLDSFLKNVEREQVSTPLEVQIDEENRSRLQQMSHDEIAEARAEILEKMNPGLLEKLKKRGENKVGKAKNLQSNRDTGCETGSRLDAKPISEDLKSKEGSPSAEAKCSPAMTPKDVQIGGMKISNKPSSEIWNAWSERVEAARMLRFSLGGHVSGIVPKHSQYNADNIAERDFLRTEGDPGALGYTIKEAIALGRSMVAGQRSLGLQLLASVFEKALFNLQQSEVGCDMKKPCTNDKSVDWQAVWAFALGPEPDLALSLRMALDDNHISVVLASVKVIHCLLSCDMNERFFDLSQKLATYDKDMYTSPVFRSRPKIDVGFLQGGFWKYNAKPSSIIPSGDEAVDAETENERTIQDDIVIAGQDIASGLVRMGLLPRICYLLETDPAAGLEEYLVSILIGIARHSPTCADAIIKCPRLVQAVVSRFTGKDSHPSPSKIKIITLVKVLAQSDKKNCVNFIEKRIILAVMWNLFKDPVSLDLWMKSGKEYCKLMSAMMIEQLRLWRVCVEYGYCVSYFTDIFPYLCMWLGPPSNKLIENNLLGEFASITREAYILLGALVRRLPNLHYREQLKVQPLENPNCNAESWSWSFVSPMVKFALKWISFESDPCLSEIFGCNKISNNSQDPSLSSCLWVISSVMYLLRGILVKVAPEGSNSSHESGGRVPWLPEFVPEIGLAILKNRYLNIGDTVLSEGGSLVKDLCDLRLHSNIEISLSSVCCLHRLVQLIVSLDKLIQLAKREIQKISSSENNFSGEGDILESGIVIWTQDQLRSVLETIMALVSSGWEKVHAIETFGRGGPAPGVGLGWGASGGGFWSGLVLLEQTDARLLMNLLDIFQIDYGRHISTVDDVNFTFVAQRIISVLGTSLTLGPRDTYIMENVLDFLLQPSVLKYLNLFVCQFLHLKRSINPCICAHNEEDYLRFSKILNSHFRNRWLCEKKKTKVVEGGVDLSQDTSEKGGNALDTIYEDSEDKSDAVAGNPHCTSLVVEWAHQRLPLPLHWFLSPISTVAGIGGAIELPNGSDLPNSMCPPSPGEAFDLAQSGLFLLLGLESLSTLPSSGLQASPVSRVPLVWKIHSLSVVLLVGMGLLYDENSRNTYETLQDLYGLLLDESRCQRSIEPLAENSLLETRIKDAVLKFQTDVHESYSTFVETLVEQFGAISYGNLVYARQVAVYLHHSVEAPVRVAAWNALSGAHLLELLPPLEKCIAKAEGYLVSEDNEGILEAYLKSWVSGTLDKAAVRGSMAFTIALHHLSSFVFQYTADDKLTLRNKIARSLLRDFSRKKQHEAMMLDLIRYAKTGTSQEHKLEPETSEIEKRFKILTGACEGNSALLSQVEKLKSFFLH